MPRDRRVFMAGAIFALDEMIAKCTAVANHAAEVDPIGSEAGCAALDALTDSMVAQRRVWRSQKWDKAVRDARVSPKKKGRRRGK